MESTMSTAKPKRGLAVTGFVLALCGLIGGWCPLTYWLGIILGVMGVVFGAIGREHGLGKAGLIIGIVAIVSSILCVVLFVAGVAAADSAF